MYTESTVHLAQTPTVFDGLYQETVNFEGLFSNLTFTPVFANDLNVDTLEGKEELSKLLYTRYEGDSLNIIPHCECGALHGAGRLDEICVVCNHPCTYITEKTLESLLWIKAPKKVKTLMSPVAWILISEAFSTAGFNLLEWLTDSSYVPPAKTVDKITRQLAAYNAYGIPRGLNSFYDHFDTIIEAVYKCKLVKEHVDDKFGIREWIAQNRKDIFTKVLPIPSKVSFVVENSGNSTYIDDNITQAFDAVHAMIAIENNEARISEKRSESKVVYVLKTLAKYYYDFAGGTLGSKPGIFRKHVFGGSLSFTARAVISSNSGVHSYDELHLPWTLSLQLLKLHITNKLRRHPYNYSPKRINNLFRDYALRYHPILDEVMEVLIKESPLGKLPCLFQRNPSLHRGAAQLLYITKIKKDPSINTITFSVLALKAPNADFVKEVPYEVIRIEYTWLIAGTHLTAIFTTK